MARQVLAGHLSFQVWLFQPSFSEQLVFNKIKPASSIFFYWDKPEHGKLVDLNFYEN